MDAVLKGFTWCNICTGSLYSAIIICSCPVCNVVSSHIVVGTVYFVYSDSHIYNTVLNNYKLM